MKNLITWPCSIIAVTLFGLTLLIGHALFLLAIPFGESAKWFVSRHICQLILLSLKFAGTSFKAQGLENITNLNGNIIIVSNHQSMIDIPFINVIFHKFRPRFIAKRELGKGLPFVSIRLRNGAGILIDRGNPAQAIKALETEAPKIAAMGGATCIFPEGTRAKDGVMKKFKSSGLKVLMKAIPNPIIVPISITRSWELLKYKMFPIPFGTALTMTVHKPIITHGQSAEAIIEGLEATIRQDIYPEKK